MSKSLIRFVDESILPAFLIVGIKVISIAFINAILSLSYNIHELGHLEYASFNDAINVNSYSDISVYFCIFLGVLFILIKLLYFSDNKTSATMILKLAKADKLNFIQTSIQIYHILFVWFVFLTGLFAYIVVRSVTGIDYIYVIIPCAVSYLTVFLIILKEIEKDIIKKLDFGKNTFV